MLVVGDSLAVGTQPFLEPMLGGAHLVADVRNGITTPEGMHLLRMSLRTVTPATVIVSLGTNDGGHPGRFRNRLSRTMALLPLNTCVVWTTIIRPPRKGPYRPLNRVLHTFKKQEPRLVVVDWEHAVMGGAVFLPDGLHADPEGYRYRSTMIADAVNHGCPARLAARLSRNPPSTIEPLPARAHIAALASVAMLLLAATPAAAAAPDPITQRPCFGAASRDSAKPCADPSLRGRIFPAPADAVLEPNAPCLPSGRTALLYPCNFGVRPVVYGGLGATIALVGDSHASHWRGAVEVVATAKRQPAISIARSRCPFIDATVALPHQDRIACRSWNRELKAYLHSHGEITTLFVSARSSATFVRAPGRSNFATQVRGHMSLWRSLPDTIRHIVVLRDTPRSSAASALCVQRQYAAGRAALVPALRASARRGAADRRGGRRGAADALAARARDRPVELLLQRAPLLSVIGGAAVYKDVDHMTAVYARSLGSYLLRAYDAILRTIPSQRAPRAPLDDLLPDERGAVTCLIAERYAASAAGGFQNVAPERLARATACRAMLEQRAAQLRALGLTGERNRARRHALIVAVLGA